MTRAEIRRRAYDKHRKVHAGHLAPLCHARGAVGPVVTCKRCIDIEKALRVGSKLNEWDRKRIDDLAKQKTIARIRAWQERNRDRVRAAAKRYREKYPDLVKIRKRAWRAKNVEHANAYYRAWYRKRRAMASLKAQQ